MTQDQTTIEVKRLVGSNLYTQKEIAKKIGVTEPTISKRLKLSNWRQKEINIIKTL